MTGTTYPKRIHVAVRIGTGLPHALARPVMNVRSECGRDVSDWTELRLASRSEVCPDCRSRMDDDPELDDDGLLLRVGMGSLEALLVVQKRNYDALEAVASLIRQKANRDRIDPALWDLEDAIDQVQEMQAKCDVVIEAVQQRFGRDRPPLPIAAVLDQAIAEATRLQPLMEDNRATISAWTHETLQRRKTTRAAAPRHRRHPFRPAQ